MKACPEQFQLTDEFASGNLRFEVADDFPHTYEYVVTYVERALPTFCKAWGWERGLTLHKLQGNLDACFVSIQAQGAKARPR